MTQLLYEGSRDNNALTQVVERADNIHRWTIREVGLANGDIIRLKNHGFIRKVGRTHEAHPIVIWSIVRRPK